MSGGHFDYQQYRISDIINTLEQTIKNERDGVVDDYGFSYELSEETLKTFERGISHLNLALIYSQRIDWLLSGDDSEESFHERLRDDLDEYFHMVGEYTSCGVE